jgi:hypothetical protein
VDRVRLIDAGYAERLDVCQNCLHELSYGGFSRGMDRAAKRKRVQDFSVAAFFA